MFEIDKETMKIHLTRGDHAVLEVICEGDVEGTHYIFQPGDVIRLKIMEKCNYNRVVFQKEFTIESETETALLELTSDETKLKKNINKPAEFWYEIEVERDDKTHTIIGHDKDGAKLLILYPEGGEL